MPRYMKCRLAEGKSFVLVEIADEEVSSVGTSETAYPVPETKLDRPIKKIIEAAGDPIQAVFRVISKHAGDFANTVQQLDSPPDEVEVSFSVSFNSEGGPVVCKVGTEAIYTVTLRCNRSTAATS